MSPFDQAGLSDSERAVVAAALRRDPWLALELTALDRLLSESARPRFWAAFASLAGAEPRPARAVVPALERAAAGRAGSEIRGREEGGRG